jgi:hypothetical protein
MKDNKMTVVDRRVKLDTTLTNTIFRDVRVNTKYFHPGRERLEKMMVATVKKLSKQVVADNLDPESAEYDHLLALAYTEARKSVNTALRIGERVTTLVWGLTPEIPATYSNGVLTSDGHPRYVVYGAAVFCKDHVAEEWRRKQHRATAFGRFMTTPVLVKFTDLAEEAFDAGADKAASYLNNITFVDGRTKDPADENKIAEAIRSFLLPKYGTDSTSRAISRLVNKATASAARTRHSYEMFEKLVGSQGGAGT